MLPGIGPHRTKDASIRAGAVRRPQNGMASSGTSLLALKAGLVVLASLRTAAGFAAFHGAMYGSTRFTRFLSPYSPVLSFSTPTRRFTFLYSKTLKSVTAPVIPQATQMSL